jgi:hypothetical protein
MKTRSNKTTKIYTVWINGVKYISMPMSKIEFDEAYFNTLNDWRTYFKSI